MCGTSDVLKASHRADKDANHVEDSRYMCRVSHVPAVPYRMYSFQNPSSFSTWTSAKAICRQKKA
jgi:hypothetical protein